VIVGDPVAQVRAPEIYNYLFQRHNVDAVWVPMKVPPASLSSFVRHTMDAQNVGGMWVTIPHKAAMQSLMDRCDPLAQIAGAVNAVRRGDDDAVSWLKPDMH
jgi:shikimate dehydrogenase